VAIGNACRAFFVDAGDDGKHHFLFSASCALCELRVLMLLMQPDDARMLSRRIP